jgi:hypothetical protein
MASQISMPSQRMPMRKSRIRSSAPSNPSTRTSTRSRPTKLRVQFRGPQNKSTLAKHKPLHRMRRLLLWQNSRSTCQQVSKMAGMILAHRLSHIEVIPPHPPREPSVDTETTRKPSSRPRNSHRVQPVATGRNSPQVTTVLGRLSQTTACHIGHSAKTNILFARTPVMVNVHCHKATNR